MKTEFFEQLIAIVESKNMTEAAMKLNMAQPTLSLSMKNFENELNAKIFEKIGRENKLTAFGEDLYRKAKVIDEEIKQLQTYVISSSDETKYLSVSNNFSLLGKDSLLDLYKKYNKKEKKLANFKVEDAAINIIIDNVASGKSEIGIVRFFIDKRDTLDRMLAYHGLEYHRLAEEDICVVVGKKNPLYYIEADTIDAEHLKNLSFVSHITETMDLLWTSCLKELNIEKITMSLASVGNVMRAVRDTEVAFIDTRKDHSHNDWYNDIRYITVTPIKKCELGWIKTKNRELTQTGVDYLQSLEERILKWREAQKLKKEAK